MQVDRRTRSIGGVGGLVVGCLVAVSVAPAVSAHDLTPRMGRPATERHHFQGNPFAVAGCPESISPLAKPTKSSHEESYYVGGGARQRSRHAGERHHGEGVYGVDYKGLVIHKKNQLGWWHGSRYQGGTGSYGPDGPRLFHRP